MKTGNIEFFAFGTRHGQWRCRVRYSEIIPGEEAKEQFRHHEFTTEPYSKRWMALEAAEGHLQTEGVSG
jgi:hypothetical protein